MSAARRLAGRMYRKLAAPFGARALRRMARNGLPARLESPLRYLFTGQASPETEEVAARIEHLRTNLAARPDAYRFEYSQSPGGMTRWPESTSGSSAGPVISSRWLATAASVPRHWGVFLRLCAEAFDARTILEVGACLGISGAYLASARTRPRLITLEGSATLAPIAEATLSSVSNRAEVVRGPFESGIHRALALFREEKLPVDVAFIDGHHDEAATLHYLRTIIPHLAPEALVILDDIHLFDGMWHAWQSAASMRGVAASVNAGRFGLLLWNGSQCPAARYDLARYTGWWPVGGRRYP